VKGVEEGVRREWKRGETDSGRGGV